MSRWDSSFESWLNRGKVFANSKNLLLMKPLESAKKCRKAWEKLRFKLT
jgi:hypothetical protein